MTMQPISRRTAIRNIAGATSLVACFSTVKAIAVDVVPQRNSQVLSGNSPFSPDGKRVLICTGKLVRVYDTGSGDEKMRFEGHGESVRTAVFSPDGSRVLTGSGREEDMASRSTDNSARLWDAASGKEIQKLMGHTGFVHSAQFDLDGQRVLTAGRDGTARIWLAESGEQTFIFSGVSYGPQVTTISPAGGKALALVGERGAVILDISSGQRICRIQADPRESRFQSAQFSPDGQRVVTASFDRTVRVWDAVTGQQVRVIGHTGFVHWAAFAANGKHIITASSDTTARIWDANTGLELWHCENPGPANHLVVSDDGRRFVTRWYVDTNNERRSGASLWDAETRREIQRLWGTFIHRFSPDSRLALASTSRWILLDSTTGKTIREFE